MLTTISDEMSVNRLVRPRNQQFRLMVNVLPPDDQRRRGFSLQTMGYMRTRGRISRAIQSFSVHGSHFSVRIQVQRSGSVLRTANPEPNPEGEYEQRSENAE